MTKQWACFDLVSFDDVDRSQKQSYIYIEERIRLELNALLICDLYHVTVNCNQTRNELYSKKYITVQVVELFYRQRTLHIRIMH